MDEQPSAVITEYDNISTPNATDLSVYFQTIKWMEWSLIPACAIFMLFCFLEKRVNLWPTCCHGRPGVAFPVNLVDSYTNRWAFAFAFGSMSTVLIEVFASGPLILHVPANDIVNTDMLRGTVQFFAYLLDALVISLVFYPILLCLQTQWKLLGNIIGLLYSITWLVFYIGSIIVTSPVNAGQGDNRSSQHEVFVIMAELATFGSGATFFLALVIFFIVGLTSAFMTGIKVGFKTADYDNPRMDFDQTHFYHRVKFLLTPPLPQKTSGNIIVRLFRKYIGTVPGFRFSRRNICTFVLTVVTATQIMLRWITSIGFGILPDIRTLSTGFVDEEVDKAWKKTESSLEATFWITSVVAICFTILYTIDMQLRYRKHTVMLWKGDRSFIPEGKQDFSAMLVASLRYSGYHVAFTMWGFLVMQLLLWVVLSIIVLFKEQALNLLQQYWLTLVVTFAFYYAQVYISQIVFLQRAPDQQEQSIFSCRRQTSFGLDNRHVFHVTVYILMFVNFILGMLSCFVRISKALLFGALYIGRLDRLLLMRDWETWDKGYTAYVGFLQLEVAHTHPVLVTFCHFLQKTVKTDQASSQKYTTNELVSIVNAQIESGYDAPETTNGRCYSPGEPSSGQFSRRVRNKWLVALTLTRNPSLVAERKAALKQTRTVSSISDDIVKRDRYVAGEAYA